MGEQCNDACACGDTCALEPGHDGIHRSADGICGWTQDHAWYGPPSSYETREGLKEEKES